MPVVRQEASKENTAWIATYVAGTFNVSNMVCDMHFCVALVLGGDSESNTGFCGIHHLCDASPFSKKNSHTRTDQE